METKTKQYVGVCGVASVEEAEKVVHLFRESGLNLKTEHIPMMGFQVSYKSLKYGFSPGNNRVPRLDKLHMILECVSRDTFPTIHYYTKEPEKLVPELEEVLVLDRIYRKGLVGGVQINGVWPTTDQISEIRGKFPELKITLQMSSAVTGDMTQQQVAGKLAAGYADIEYIILDSSHGTGVEFDTAEIASTYRTFRENGVRSAVVFAGGFNGDNVKEKLAQLMRVTNTRDFSIDAEGGLRDRVGEGYGNDLLNLNKVQSYLRGSSEVLLRKT